MKTKKYFAHAHVHVRRLAESHTWNPAVFSKVVILCTNPKAENTCKFKILFLSTGQAEHCGQSMQMLIRSDRLIDRRLKTATKSGDT